MKTLFIGTGMMGQNNSLLYWHPILCALSKITNNLHLFISNDFIEKLPGSIEIVPPFKFISLFGINLPSPKFLLEIIKIRPKTIITSEFGAISAIAAIYKILYKKSRLIILVENHPKFLAGYGKDRGKKFNLIRSLIAKSADTIIASNLNTQNYLAKDLKCSESKIITAPYLTSVRKSNFSNELKATRDHIQIVSTGQAIKRKGFDHLIREIKLLPEEIKVKIKVKIIGDGEELANLINQSKKEGLSNLITFTGKISYGAITNELSDADIFVMPTLGDYRSLALFEALSAGLPLLGSCYDGSSEEIIISGQNGEIFDPLSPGDLAKKICALINNQKIHSYSQASLNISKKFTVEAAAYTLSKAINNN